ncbi:MAG TPA: arylesterase [Vicinamibacterales bacterium]|nr:arylesterase [Vicinamibacterales bacterium]
MAVCLVWASGCGAGGCLFGVSVERDQSASQAPSDAAGGSAQPADPSAPRARPKIVFLGDSLTVGLGLLESQSYPSLIQNHLDEDGYRYEVVNAGVSGDTSAGGLRRLDWALDGDVRVLVVALGANDGLRGLSVADMKQNLTSIIDRARARNIVVILAGMEAPPNYGPEYTQSFRAAFREVASQERVLFIPFLLNNVAGVSSLNQADGIHPDVEGAKLIAETVWPVLRSVLDQMAGSQ